MFDVDDVRSSAAADARLFAKLEAAPRVDLGDVLAGSARGTVRVEYDGSFAAYAALARRLGAMDNEKAGVPRGAYRGVVELRRGPVSVLLSPPLDRVRARSRPARRTRGREVVVVLTVLTWVRRPGSGQTPVTVTRKQLEFSSQLQHASRPPPPAELPVAFGGLPPPPGALLAAAHEGVRRAAPRACRRRVVFNEVAPLGLTRRQVGRAEARSRT